MRNNKLFILSIFASASLLILSYTGCKKYNDPPPVFEELKDLSVNQRKVLIIGIDGLGGSELEEIAPTNIMELQKNAKFSYSALGGTTDAGGWATLTTGTTYDKNQISTDAFQPTRDPSATDHAEVKYYRNVLDYITQFEPVKAAVITPWESLRNYLRNSDFFPELTTDKAVKDSTIELLNNQTSLGAIVVNFRDVEAAGNAGEFTPANTGYANAVKTTDGYIGEIMKALTSRKNYDKEEWLVIITTNHGGSSTSPTKGFVLAYNPLFKSFELKQNGFSTVDFQGPDVVASVADDNGLYNMGTDKDFTVQMQTKFINQGGYYPRFLGKSTPLAGGLTGWYWMQEGTQWNLEFGGVADGGAGKQQLGISNALSGGWHTLTMTVKYIDASTRTASAYLDGVFKASYNVSNTKNINTNELLTIGGDDVTDFYAANLTIFNKALDAATVAANVNLKHITQHPDYANLIGFWPINEGAGGVLSNLSPIGYNMNLQGPFKWSTLGDDIPAGTPIDLNYVSGAPSYISNLADVTAMTLYWMKIKILPDYEIDGSPTLDKFEIEFLK